MLIINVIQSTFTLIVEFDACQVLPYAHLMSQLKHQGYSFYMYPISRPTEKPGICPQWTNVGCNTEYKGHTSPFHENPKGCTRTQNSKKTLISTVQNNRQSFNRLHSKLQLFQKLPFPTYKDKQCNPLRKPLEYKMRTINILYV
jgi:hypothetical protein